jgi:co-chaperonin GroES (HSP10)
MQQVQMGNALKNDEWIDGAEIADPITLPHLPGFHVLVRPVSVKRKTKGGIFIPDSTRDDMAYLTTVGRVLKLGELAYKDKEKFPNGPWCKEGEFIVYGRYAGSRFQTKFGEHRILNDDEIIAKIKKPEDILQLY